MRQPILSNLSGLWIALCLLAFAQPKLRANPPDNNNAKGVEFFERQIRPLLADRCYQCHSRASEKAKGGLLLDSREQLLKGSDSGPIVVAGDPDKSLLLTVVRERDEDLRMPPDGDRLTDAQIADLEIWVEIGAPLPQTEVREDHITASSRAHWAFQPVTRPAVPVVKKQGWVKSPVDAFISISARRTSMLFQLDRGDALRLMLDGR